MDSALKELDKLQKLTDFRDSSSRLSITPSTSAKGKQTVSIPDALDNLLASLYSVKKKIESGLATEQDLAGIVRSVDERKKEIDDRQKEIHATLGRIGKTLDKVGDWRVLYYYKGDGKSKVLALETCYTDTRAPFTISL